MYDTELGRWFGMDPECEGHVSESPYAFCGGNALSRVDADGRDYWSTTNPAEIRRFLNSLRWDYRNPLEHFDFGGWEHETDRDFLNGLTFNDRTRRFMFDYGALVNREASRIGVSWKADLVFGYSASYLTYYGRYIQPREEWYAKASGRVAPDYTLETVGIPVGKGVQLWMQATRYSRLVKAAQKLYPNKAGKIEMHHITPKYIGGDKNGPLVPLDGAYHQQITNAFRRAHSYGAGRINNPVYQRRIMDQVYKQYPLPRGYKY